MLYFMYEGRKDPSKLGLIHICTFILLLLSGERNFCVNLNAGLLLFFFTLVTGPRRSVSLKLSDTRVCEP